MTKLKVSLKGENSTSGNKQYCNVIDAKNFKQIALVLGDLRREGLPIDKAILELRRSNINNFDDILGI